MFDGPPITPRAPAPSARRIPLKAPCIKRPPGRVVIAEFQSRGVSRSFSLPTTLRISRPTITSSKSRPSNPALRLIAYDVLRVGYRSTNTPVGFKDPRHCNRDFKNAAAGSPMTSNRHAHVSNARKPRVEWKTHGAAQRLRPGTSTPVHTIFRGKLLCTQCLCLVQSHVRGSIVADQI